MNGYSMTTISEINECNRRFWDEQKELLVRRMANPAIREAAMRNVSDEQTRGVPVYYRIALEKALENAERDKVGFLSQQAGRGGRAKKSDALQRLILDLVRTHPEITEVSLKAMLTRERFPGVIEDVDETNICFVRPDGRLKESPLSGLKHRLSRAKKIL